jgi:membrane-associated progesterone receptor component
MSAPSPQQQLPRAPQRQRTVFLPVIAIVLGVAGLLFALWPSLISSAGSSAGCPQSIRAMRSSWGIDAAIDVFHAVADRARFALMPAAAPATSRGVDEVTGLPIWNLADLARYKGERGMRVALGVCGRVYDVTELGGKFYGPGKSYSMFAGRDATRALAMGVTSEADISGDVEDLEDRVVQEQCSFYENKYGPPVGILRRV